MGINNPANSILGSISAQFFFSFFFFFSANMNLTVFAGILLAVPMAAARRASLGEKTMQAADKADEPVEAMRGAVRPARLVKKIMRAADEAYEPKEAKRAKSAEKKEIKAEKADEDKKDEAEVEEVDDAKTNKIVLRQKIPDCCWLTG